MEEDEPKKRMKCSRGEELKGDEEELIKEEQYGLQERREIKEQWDNLRRGGEILKKRRGISRR